MTIYANFKTQFFTEWREIDFSEKKLKHFGWLVGGILIAIALWYKTSILIDLGIMGVILVILGFLKPLWLKVVYVVWMRLGIVLGFIVSRLLLTLIFILVLTPLGWLKRLFSGDTLGRNFKVYKSKTTFWIKTK